MSENTIASLTVDCLRCFQTFNDEWITAPSECSFGISDLETELGRFRLWADNIGARNHGRSGLDYRLRDAQYMRENVIALLQDLEETLQDGTHTTE